MSKQLKQLLVMLVVLGALAAAFFGLKKYNVAQNFKADEDTGEYVFDVLRDDVVSFTYDYNGETYTFEKVDDTWYYAEDHSLEIIQYQITSMLVAVTPLETEAVIEGVTNLEQYGLGESKRVIQYETESDSYIFEVGDYNTVSGVYYIRKPSEDTVYAVPPAVVTSFNRTLDSLIEEQAETVEPEENSEE